MTGHHAMEELAGRRVLVTGGGGFVGSHLVEALVPYADVRVLDDFSTGRRAHVPDDATVIDGDVRDRSTIESAVTDVEVVFHQAAVVSVDRSVEEPWTTNRTNLDGGLAVLEAARREGARVVIASSAAIYGHPSTLPIPESAAPDPRSPYGIQKFALDAYARRYADIYDLPTVTLRYFNVYGPRQRGPYSGVISTFLDRALANDAIPIEGDGGQSRDFVHVTDVVRANLLAATTDATGEAFNVGTGDAVSIRTLAETIRRLVDADEPIPAVHRDPRPGDVRHSRADAQKAADVLGFEASVDLETGLRNLLDSDAQNRTPRANDLDT